MNAPQVLIHIVSIRPETSFTVNIDCGVTMRKGIFFHG